ncbi:NTP transferase domain-containing protein [Candidatus Curtissbacteria bacterium]|nr:NTP transferase domain-containing protein [Candidatus Curtissbacteria bacterium]
MNNNSQKSFAAIVLAAGEGKRMRSSLPKVLHPVDQKPLLKRTLEIIDKVRPRQIIIVINQNNSSQIKKTVGNQYTFANQQSPAGTADAARIGLRKTDKNVQIVAVMYGDDTAFYKPETIKKIFEFHRRSKSKITFVTLDKESPFGLGRILRKNDRLFGIIEEKDASPTQKKIKEVNDGLYFFNKNWLGDNLLKIKPSSVTGELYLTDLISIALNQGDKVQTYKLEDPSEWHGINTPEELEIANKLIATSQIRDSSAKEVELQKLKIHIMGAAGAGASAILSIAKSYGYEVTGCDLNPASPYTQNLKIDIAKGHSRSHLIGIDLLVISPAVEKFNSQNLELVYASKGKIPIISWQKFQGEYLQKNKFVIAVAGAYGKSTTTAMIAQILIDAGLDPTCEIGAKVLGWETNFRVGKSKYYICEADEYNDNFLYYHPDIAVILNIGWDHPDFFKTREAVINSYKKFIENIKPGGTIILGSVPTTKELIESTRAPIKGTDPAKTRVVKVKDFTELKLSIIGDFRKENAKAALTVAKILKIDPKLAKKSVESFSGLCRRLEYKGTINQVRVYDDYAVQPYTILKTSNALKEKSLNKKVVLVFEPHTFSRIETFFADFVKSLKESKVDQILITDVYPAREKGDKVILAQKLARSVGSKAQYSGSLEATARYLSKHLSGFGVILSMGAGDVYKLFDLVKNHTP